MNTNFQSGMTLQSIAMLEKVWCRLPNEAAGYIAVVMYPAWLRSLHEKVSLQRAHPVQVAVAALMGRTTSFVELQGGN
jgi:hypothetical protein